MRKLVALAFLLPSLTFAAEPFGLRGLELGKPFDHTSLPDCKPAATACDGTLDVLTFKGQVYVTAAAGGDVNSIMLSFATEHFGELRAALVQKYGQPRQAATLAKQNGYGARVAGRALVWRQGDSEMLLDERADLDSGALTIRRIETRVSAGL